jgi:hypothetical protein
VSKYPGHAFGHYFLSECYRGTGHEALAEEHLARFLEVCERDTWWRDMAEKYQVHFHAAPSIVPLASPAVTQAAH